MENPGGPLDFCCESYVDPDDGSTTWCCSCNENEILRCYLGEHIVGYDIDENDGIVHADDETYGDGWVIDNVDHFGATKSTDCNRGIIETLIEWELE